MSIEWVQTINKSTFCGNKMVLGILATYITMLLFERALIKIMNHHNPTKAYTPMHNITELPEGYKIKNGNGLTIKKIINGKYSVSQFVEDYEKCSKKIPLQTGNQTSVANKKKRPYTAPETPTSNLNENGNASTPPPPKKRKVKNSNNNNQLQPYRQENSIPNIPYIPYNNNSIALPPLNHLFPYNANNINIMSSLRQPGRNAARSTADGSHNMNYNYYQLPQVLSYNPYPSLQHSNNTYQCQGYDCTPPY